MPHSRGRGSGFTHNLRARCTQPAHKSAFIQTHRSAAKICLQLPKKISPNREAALRGGEGESEGGREEEGAEERVDRKFSLLPPPACAAPASPAVAASAPKSRLLSLLPLPPKRLSSSSSFPPIAVVLRFLFLCYHHLFLLLFFLAPFFHIHTPRPSACWLLKQTFHLLAFSFFV